MFVSDAGKKLLCGDYTQYTPSGKNLFVKRRRYGNIPHPGDPVYFFSQSLGRVAHVGIVIEVTKSGDIYTIKTVEGNTSSGSSFDRNGGCVAIKTYSFTTKQVGRGNRIDGFGTPIFSDDTCGVETFIETAKGEVGYIEKTSNHNLESKTANAGNRNFTKYGEWYGGNGLYWCQQFVSWVAYAACDKTHKKRSKKGWSKKENSWYYTKENGELAKGEWQEIDGRWYVFDESGKAIKGWFEGGGSWYYLGEDNAMISGQWLEYKGDYYYLDKSGAMARNVYVEMKNGRYFFINEDGKCSRNANPSDEDFKKYQTVLEGE